MTPIASQTSSTQAMILEPSFVSPTQDKISRIYENNTLERFVAHKQILQPCLLREDPKWPAIGPALDLLQENGVEMSEVSPEDLDDDLFNFIRPEIDEFCKTPVENELSNELSIQSSKLPSDPAINADQGKKTYYEKNKERIKAKRVAYYAKNREKAKAYRENNK